MTDVFIDEVAFWGLFLAFNFSVYAFNYAIQARHTLFWPFTPKVIRSGNLGVFMSKNADFFRLSMEVSLMILLVRFKVIYVPHFFVVLFCIIHVFNVYHHGFAFLYKRVPILAGDLKLLRDGIAIVSNESKSRFFLGLIIAIISIYLLYVSFFRFLEFGYNLSVTNSAIAGATLILIFILAGLYRKGIVPKSPFIYRYESFFIAIFFHLRYSIRLSELANRIEKNITTEVIFSEQHQFSNKPNIYLLFIESYGRILLADKQLSKHYLPHLGSFQSKVKEGGWAMKSALSESVSIAGPSWLAYSSLMYGLRIDNQFLYERLMINPEFYQKMGLFKILKDNGYKNFNLNPTKWNNTLKVPMDDLTRFYHVDQWILREDINYEADGSGFGEFPPDQYSLNYTYHHFLKYCSDPFVLFYLTKNSHSPFVAPKSISEDWQALRDQNTKDLAGGGFLKQPTKIDYMNAIHYELEVLEDFILNNGSENDIFLLMGDHQPHVLADEFLHGKETIVHLIAKDPDFVNKFDQYGFRERLTDAPRALKHEGLHWAFVRELLQKYGNDQVVVPKYHHDGIRF